MDRFALPHPWEETGASYADMEEAWAEAELDRLIEERGLRGAADHPLRSDPGGA